MKNSSCQAAREFATKETNMNAYIYPTPAALKRARAATQEKPSAGLQELADTFAELFGAPPRLDIPPPGFIVDDEPTFEERVALADARLMMERAARKALRQRIKVRKEFKGVWASHKTGERTYITEMPTMHLFYAVRMVWNHSVEEFYRFDQFGGKPMKTYPEVSDWPVRYRRTALGAMLDELGNRDWSELPSEAYSQFVGIRALASLSKLK